MRRRSFLIFLGGAATASLPSSRMARAQQRALPVIGFLSAGSPETNADRLRALHRGLKEEGYVEGDNVSVLYRWAEDHVDRLPSLAADLVGRRVAVLASFGTAPGLASKAATTTIPVVFAVGQD